MDDWYYIPMKEDFIYFIVFCTYFSIEDEDTENGKIDTKDGIINIIDGIINTCKRLKNIIQSDSKIDTTKENLIQKN